MRNSALILLFTILPCGLTAAAGNDIADQYVRRFDNAYVDAGGSRPLADLPPLDPPKVVPALQNRRTALALCDASIPRAWLDCCLAADQTYATATRMRDTALFDAYARTLRRAGADAQAARLDKAEVNNVYTAVNQAYAAILSAENFAYQMRHLADSPDPGADGKPEDNRGQARP